jgi:hypothetical protein
MSVKEYVAGLETKALILGIVAEAMFAASVQFAKQSHQEF